MSRPHVPIAERFSAVAAERGGAPCIENARGGILTYDDVLAGARAIASGLERAGASPGEAVALELPRSAEWVVSFLGCWFSATVPVPIDPRLPAARRETYAARSGATTRVAIAGSVTEAPTFERAAIDRVVSDRRAISDDDPLAWIIFTSGTSGEPKGVEIEHAGVLPVLRAQIDHFRIDASSRSLWVLSPAFDASLSDVFTTLLAGATIVIDDALDPADPDALFAALREHAITHVDLPPALLPHLDPDRLAPTIRTIVIGGEVADAAAVRRLCRRTRVVNVYGPTEATICTSLSVCDETWSRPLIGTPIGDALYRLEDGELLIGGCGVARGYRGMPALSRDRFVLRRGQRFFRTGDRVRRDPDGALVFEGRLDRQRKLRGQLVAPEEIEASLEAHPRVRRATVTLDDEVTAAIESRGTVSDSELRAHVAAMLPSYMVPTRIIRHDRLPVTPNGKLDRRAASRGDEESPTLRALSAIVARVVSLPRVEADAAFPDLGGTSLAALEVVAAAEALGLPLRAEALLTAPSLSSLARSLDSGENEEAPTVASLACRVAPLLTSLPTPGALLARRPPESILVTGATGFLGARIVSHLLHRTDARIVCLTRGRSDATARSRVMRALDELGAGGDAQRIEVLASDLTQPSLGLEAADYRRLARTVDHVVHSAARVSVTAPFGALYPANVEGTMRVIAFAMAARRKRLTHASTLSVFVSTDDAEGDFDEDRSPRPDAVVFGGYAQSKVAAEHLVRQAAPGLGGTQIVRYGLLTGEAATGRGPAIAWLPRTIRGLRAVGVVPEDVDPDLEFDVTPVDYAAALTAQLLIHASDGVDVFHIAGQRAASFSLLRAAMNDEGIDLRDVPHDVFLHRIAATLAETPDPDVGAACLALSRALGASAAHRHRGMDLFEATRARFGTGRARAVSASELECPLPTRELLRTYVRAAVGETR